MHSLSEHREGEIVSQKTQNRPTVDELQTELTTRATELEIPGAAVGIVHDGEELYAFHGVTSIENPLDVDENTLFQFGSTGKTHTATAIMRLVEQGKVDLHEKVRKYVPEFKVRDEDVASEVTVLHLLNHTAGWSGDLLDPTGDGDDALERYVELMADLEQMTPLGKAMSYNNASLSLAGRLIQKVTGLVYEQAIKEMILEPLGLKNTFFFPNDIMTRRFAAGHNRKPDGTLEVARPWALPRSGWPAGGMSSNAADLIAWARFHLGDGSPLLTKESLDLMKEPTFDMRGGALGDYVGISWLMRDVAGGSGVSPDETVRLVGHGGNSIGQNSTFTMVPERGFAFVSITNDGSHGDLLSEGLERWALERFADVVLKDPEPIKLADAALAEYIGTYDTIAVVCQVSAADGGLVLRTEVRPEVWAKLSEDDVPEPDDYPLGMLPGDRDRYIITDGDAKGMKGYFARDDSGRIEAVHIGGRLAQRVR
jgi:CubicO group peptidase (beta-lactamase class C family)